ncbi:MAG: prolipoprotein diacylglyceryl transferase [Candidatus Aenigmarchaeota archaeon]|nr:prolipoprotein diacylglyceryl transferase [Candidatus Aenigmarchaeota archaeon]
MFINTIDPVLLTIGQFEIRYYGIVISLGILFTLIVAQHIGNQRDIKKDTFIDLVIWISIGSLIFSRAFEIFIYHPAYYLADPIKMLMIHNGGLSFHGGLTGGFLATLLFSKKRKIPLLDLTDILILPISLGLAFGRLANFTNHELYGKITDLPWAVKFATAEGYRHPTQIYEAIKNLAIFTVLLSINKRYDKHKKGTITFAFLGLYGSIRFLIEFLKDMPQHYGLTTGQWLCIPMILISAAFFAQTIKQKRTKEQPDKKSLTKKQQNKKQQSNNITTK